MGMTMVPTGTRTKPRGLKLPPSGPRDELVWLTLEKLAFCDEAVIDDETGELWLIHADTRQRWRIDPKHLDELIALGWLDDGRGWDELHLTERANYWLSRFLKLNPGR